MALLLGVQLLPPIMESGGNGPFLVGRLAGPVRQNGDVIEAVVVRYGSPLGEGWTSVLLNRLRLDEARQRGRGRPVNIRRGGVLRADDGHDKIGNISGKPRAICRERWLKVGRSTGGESTGALEVLWDGRDKHLATLKGRDLRPRVSQADDEELGHLMLQGAAAA